MSPPGKILFFRPEIEPYLLIEETSQEVSVHTDISKFRNACKKTDAIQGVIICIETPINGTSYTTFEAFHLVFFLRYHKGYEGPILLTSYFPAFDHFEKDRDTLPRAVKKYEYFFKDPAIRFINLIDLAMLRLREIDKKFPESLKPLLAQKLRDEYYNPVVFFARKIKKIEQEICRKVSESSLSTLETQTKLEPLKKELIEFGRIFFEAKNPPQFPLQYHFSTQKEVRSYCEELVVELSKYYLPEINGEKEIMIVDREAQFAQNLLSSLSPYHIKGTHFRSFDHAIHYFRENPKKFTVVIISDFLNEEFGKISPVQMADLVKEVTDQKIKWIKLTDVPSHIRTITGKNLEGAASCYFKEDFLVADHIRENTLLQLVSDICKGDIISPFQGDMEEAYQLLCHAGNWEEQIEKVQKDANAFLLEVFSGQPSGLNIKWQSGLTNKKGIREEVFFNRLKGRLIILALRNLMCRYPIFFSLPKIPSIELKVIRYIMETKGFNPFKEWSTTEKNKFNKEQYTFFSPIFNIGTTDNYDYTKAHSFRHLLPEEQTWLETFGAEWIKEGSKEGFFKRIIDQSQLGKP